MRNMILKFNQTYKWLFLPLLSVLLSACNTDINDNKSSNKQSQDQKITLSADNAVDGITNGLKSYVSLEDKIHATSSLGDNMISEVVLLSEQQACRDIDVYASGYSINSADYIGTCIYQYSVKNTVDPTARAVAYSTVVVQEDEVGSIDKFELISETAEASVTLVINIADQLVDQIPDGYTLSETITNLGVGNASLDIGSQTITFISDQPGYSQIIYSYENDTQVKIGSINIAVSSELNTAPVAPNIDYSADINNETVNINTDVIIDVGSYISDPDDEPLQLVYVDSWYASVTPVDLSDENNTAFIFNTDRAGEHFVTYAISDHNGGYDIGQVRIEVYDPNSVASWGNIQQGLKIYYGPLTYAEANSQGISVTSSIFDNNSMIATFNYSSAVDSCKSIGRLPTKDELNALLNSNPNGSYSWPIGLPYWTSSDNEVIDLNNGNTLLPARPEGYYVSCINEGGFVIDTANSSIIDIVANDGINESGIATVITKLSFNGKPISGEEVRASVTNDVNASLDSSSVITNDDGIAAFKLTDLKAEDILFTVDYEGEQRTVNIVFVADKSTAKINSSATVNNQPAVGGSNTVTAVLTDENGNPISGEVINFNEVISDYANVSLVPITANTDLNGKQKVSVNWTGDIGMPSLSANIESKYKNQTDVTTVSFNGSPSLFFQLLIDNAKYGQANWAQVTLTYSDGSPIKNAVVSIEAASSMSVNGELRAPDEPGGYFSTHEVVTDNTGKVMLELILYNTGNFQSTSTRITARYLDQSKFVTGHWTR
ncbi:hypothetical protein GNP79_05880 [Aliivibrio fischeri]|uniref:Big-1 domain-containing protein n=1 Tax=Aliivibrio fischeri TaxID=668 RepID=A0A6N3YX14_ALIFS|nr:hypothetical protein [Aliivibrio fischeri]MUJ29120.1 hypothetical protein [Aliivibrio fischeri]MUK44087.1 hypothetical protein [Aliivibrio fischeri]MUK80330.1 hypothetical protein [Aliivibrio fischeri]MUK85158.1 hypothetical protein [Aliivibrio fischeri]